MKRGLILPQKLPCGCHAISCAEFRNVVVLYDGTRICKHRKRWKLIFQEIKMGDDIS